MNDLQIERNRAAAEKVGREAAENYCDRSREEACVHEASSARERIVDRRIVKRGFLENDDE